MFSRQEEVYGIQDVQCNGTEYMLSDCQNSTAISDECLNGSHVAGVRCVDSKHAVITYNILTSSLTLKRWEWPGDEANIQCLQISHYALITNNY